MMTEFHDKLIRAAQRYDARQRRNKRRVYNVFALSQYLKRIEEVEDDITNGASPRAALIAGFTGPLLNAMLKAIGEPKYVPGEKPQATYLGLPVYKPVSEE